MYLYFGMQILNKINQKLKQKFGCSKRRTEGKCLSFWLTKIRLNKITNINGGKIKKVKKLSITV